MTNRENSADGFFGTTVGRVLSVILAGLLPRDESVGRT